jgi:flagellar protein FlaG
MTYSIGQLTSQPAVPAPRAAGSPSPATGAPQAPGAATPAGDRTDVLPARPPRQVMDEVAAAARRVDELRAQGRELHFTTDEASRRVVIQVRSLDGTVLRTIPPSKAIAVMSGEEL